MVHVLTNEGYLGYFQIHPQPKWTVHCHATPFRTKYIYQHYTSLILKSNTLSRHHNKIILLCAKIDTRLRNTFFKRVMPWLTELAASVAGRRPQAVYRRSSCCSGFCNKLNWYILIVIILVNQIVQLINCFLQLI